MASTTTAANEERRRSLRPLSRLSPYLYRYPRLVVGAIISLTRHAAVDVDDYVERISSRLDALNRAQNVLLGANFLTGSMHALMREVEAWIEAEMQRLDPDAYAHTPATPA